MLSIQISLSDYNSFHVSLFSFRFLFFAVSIWIINLSFLGCSLYWHNEPHKLCVYCNVKKIDYYSMLHLSVCRISSDYNPYCRYHFHLYDFLGRFAFPTISTAESAMNVDIKVVKVVKERHIDTNNSHLHKPPTSMDIFDSIFSTTLIGNIARTTYYLRLRNLCYRSPFTIIIKFIFSCHQHLI